VLVKRVLRRLEGRVGNGHADECVDVVDRLRSWRRAMKWALLLRVPDQSGRPRVAGRITAW